MIPSPWHFALLVLVAFRLFRLLAEDDITERPRKWALKRLPEKAELFLTCPACAGFWLSAIVYLCWLWLFGDYDTPSDLLVGAAVVLAVNAVVIGWRRNVDPPPE